MSEPRQKPVFARVEQDLARGDLGAARRRLESFARSQPYDPELLSRIGELALRMGDPAVAGRAYLLSSASGPEIDAAVDAFVRSNGGDSRAVIGRLLRLPGRAEVPDVARRRLERYGIALKAGMDGQTPRRPVTWKQRVAVIGCLLVTLVAAFLMFAGVVQLVHWLRR